MPIGDNQTRLWRPGRGVEMSLVATLLVIHALLGWSSLWNKGVTFDEPVHVAPGYAAVVHDDFRFGHAQMLVDLWMALPAAATESIDLRESPAWDAAAWYGVGHYFLFNEGHDTHWLLLQGRSMIMILSLGLALLVWWTARGLWGTFAGLLALALYALSPTILAHARLMTGDLAAAALFLASVLALWAVLHRLTFFTLAASLLLGAALVLTKAAGALIVPISLILAVIRLAYGRPWHVSLGRRTRIIGRPRMTAAVAGVAAAHLVAGVVLVWAFYGFEYAAIPGNDPAGRAAVDAERQLVLSQASPRVASMFETLHDHRLLPEPFLASYGRYVKAVSGRRAFLNGDYSLTGWWYFFPYAFLVKTPLPTLLLLMLAAAGAAAHWTRGSPGRLHLARRVGRGLYRTAPLWVLILVYGGIALGTNLNIGHRHILPIYPPLFVLAGAAAYWLRRASVVRYLVPACVLVLAVECVMIWPHYLAYFNAFAGGPTQGYRHLVDSSLDWGQDLPGLRDYLAERDLLDQQHTPVYLSYFGTDRPERFGIDAQPLIGFFDQRRDKSPRALRPGVYAVSATMLQGVYLEDVWGPWRPQLEALYQQHLRAVGQLESTEAGSPERQALVEAHGQEAWARVLEKFDRLRTARLFAYLRQFEPAAQVGYSIMVYDVDAEHLQAALFGPPPMEVAPAQASR